MDLLFLDKETDIIVKLSNEEYINTLTNDTNKLLQNILKLISATKILQKKLNVERLKHKHYIENIKLYYEDKIYRLEQKLEDKIIT